MQINYSSQANIDKMISTFQSISKDPVDVEFIDGIYYAFTTELGALRLREAYSLSSGSTRFGYSKNLNEWFFGLRVAN